MQEVKKGRGTRLDRIVAIKWQTHITYARFEQEARAVPALNRTLQPLPLALPWLIGHAILREKWNKLPVGRVSG